MRKTILFLIAAFFGLSSFTAQVIAAESEVTISETEIDYDQCPEPDSVWEAMKTAGCGIKAGSKTAGEEIKEGSKTIGQEIKEGSKKAGTEIKEGSKKAGTEIKEGSKKAGAAIKEGAHKTGEGFKKAGKGIKDFFTGDEDKKKD